MKGNIIKGLWVLVVVSCVAASCTTIKNSGLQSQIDKSNCNQQNTYQYTKDELPKPLYQIELDTILTNRFSKNSLNIAHAIGALDLITHYAHKSMEKSNRSAIEYRMELIELNQQINHRIDLASLEISALSSELDCEEERANQIASFMKEKEGKIESFLNVSAIVIGAAGAVVTGILFAEADGSNAADVIGIGTGLAEAVLGVLMLTVKTKIYFHHERNSLREVWFKTETSEVFPPSIWYYLNYSNPNQPDKPSLRDQVIKSWQNFGQVQDIKEKKKKQLIDIYFSQGGKYTADELENRANMYDQLESAIKLMKQDLKDLMVELEKL
jgi:hypothetical protein